MSNVLLDVGGHCGETVKVALRQNWKFKQVHSFEPDIHYCKRIETEFHNDIVAGRLIVHPVGLGALARQVPLFGDNAGGAATIVSEFLDAAGAAQARQIVQIEDINQFIVELDDHANIFIKINCEGAEVEIVERLCELAAPHRIRSLLVDFDTVKSSFGYWKKRTAITKARAAGLPLVLAENVMVGRRHDERIENWFSMFPELHSGNKTPRRQPWKRRLRYTLKDLKSAIGISAKGYS